MASVKLSCDCVTCPPAYLIWSFYFLMVEAATRNQFSLSSESTPCSHGTWTFWPPDEWKAVYSQRTASQARPSKQRPRASWIIGLLLIKLFFAWFILVMGKIWHQNKLSHFLSAHNAPCSTLLLMIYISCNYPQVRSSCLSYSTSIRRNGMCVTELAGSTSLCFSESAQCCAHPHVTMAASS